MRWLGYVAPKLTAQLAFLMWHYPRHHKEPGREYKWRIKADHFVINLQNEKLAAYRWGNGKTVLLVHGWDGRGVQLGAFADPLTEAGYEVVAFDLPAHGQSTGKRTNMLEAAAAIQGVADAIGPIDTVIAHSFGAGALAKALRNGLAVNKVVLISPPANLRWMADNFYQMLRLRPRIQKRIEILVNNHYGESIWKDVSADQNLRGLTTPGLIVHDSEDMEVPFSQTEALLDIWPNVQLLRTNGLGHRRILRDKKVIQRVMDFLG